MTRKDGHHPIIFMQCRAVRYRGDAKAAAVAQPIEHTVHVRATSFRPMAEADPDQRMQFHHLYQELIADDQRNQIICDEVVQNVREGRSPLVLTECKEHLQTLAKRLEGRVQHVVILQCGTGIKQTRTTADRLNEIT